LNVEFERAKRQRAKWPYLPVVYGLTTDLFVELNRANGSR
jgi:hypothetical protein